MGKKERKCEKNLFNSGWLFMCMCVSLSDETIKNNGDKKTDDNNF